MDCLQSLSLRLAPLNPLLLYTGIHGGLHTVQPQAVKKTLEWLKHDATRTV